MICLHKIWSNFTGIKADLSVLLEILEPFQNLKKMPNPTGVVKTIIYASILSAVQISDNVSALLQLGLKILDYIM